MTRDEILSALAERIRTHVTGFRLVRPYLGDMTGPDTFLSRIQGALPCALVVMDATRNAAEDNRRMKLRSDLVVFLAARSFQGSGGDAGLYELLDATQNAVHGWPCGIPGAGDFRFQNDRHVAHTDTLVIFEQRFSVLWVNP